MPVPTEEEWGSYKTDLDAGYVYSVFAGKSNDDVQIDFEQNVIEKTDELRWMPIVPFQYYMLGLRQFIETRAQDFDDRSDAASCFIRLVEEKLKDAPDFIFPIIDELMPTVKYVAENQSRFDADKSIYGDFIEIYENILKLIRSDL